MAGKRQKPPAPTIEGREEELINLATNLAEQKIRDGTASSSLILHFLKEGSRNSRLDRDIKELQKDLIEAKTENLNQSKHLEELYENAVSHMRKYSGDIIDDEVYYEEDF